MYFQIAVSPIQQTKKQQSVAPLEDVALLKLAPFSPIPKICFDNVIIGEVETKKLIIQNPNASKTKFTVTKCPPAITLSWNEAEIEAHEEIVLEVSWAPTQEGGWREILCTLDHRNVNRNIPITLKSIQKKGKRRTINKKTAKTKEKLVALPVVKKFQSPKNMKKKRISPLKVSEQPQSCSPKTYQCESCHNNIHITTCSPIKIKRNTSQYNKENSPLMFQQKIDNISPVVYQPRSDNSSFSTLSFSEKLNRMDNTTCFSSPTNVSFNCENILQTPIRRGTYAINSQPIILQNSNLNISPDNFNDSLELDVPAKNNESKSNESFIKKLNMDSTEIHIRNNIINPADYLVQKLLSDSFAHNTGTATTTKNTPDFKMFLNNTEVLEVPFYPNNCSTETKIIEKVFRNNSSTPKELFKLDSTYELSPGGRKQCSPDNIALNSSSGTYTLSNVSSSSTYALLSPKDIHYEIRDLIDNDKQDYPNINTLSPILVQSSNQFHAAPNYLNFSGINAKTALSCIEEEQPSTSTRNSSIRSDLNISGFKRKADIPDIVFNVSPPKRAFIKPKSPKPASTLNTSWSRKIEKTERIRRKSISSLRLNLSKSKTRNTSISTVNSTQTTCNIDPFLIAAMYDSNTIVSSTLDPFISSSLYYDETWLEKQMQELKKWLNALLTPPLELATAAECKKVDVAKLWQECVKKDLIYAPTKEKISSKYHTNHKLELLRKSAKNLFHSFEMRNVLSKVTVIIENKQLSIREDKNLHLDVGLQSHILTLLLCYNPLWLRIGLETIYNEPIPLDSNSDVIGLSTFIMLRFFRCPDLVPKNKKQTSHMKYLPGYAAAIKKFTLKKFLLLIYFLDQAKTKKLISHDPCLFCRDAPIKESKELLLSFSRELLSAVGDVTKFLRRLGYEVSHKQSYIDEFDYAVKSLGTDLRDGIRLTKVMEIILLRNDLTNQLRGPTVSRLQKVHNVKLALDSLSQAGYNIAGEITSKDIVDGHREKTLSLLWQIIYKFQAPRFSMASTKIQIWWNSLQIVIKRRILDRPRQLRINSAIIIQHKFRAYLKMKKCRENYLKLKKTTLYVQERFRANLTMKKTRESYSHKRRAAILIQQKFRANLEMKKSRENYLKLKKAALYIQERYRANLAMKKTKETYLHKQRAAMFIQCKFRDYLVMKKCRENYIKLQKATLCIQERFRANLAMKKRKESYLHQRRAAIYIQHKFRAYLEMEKCRINYLKLKKATLCVQERLRANLAMRNTRASYLHQRSTVIFIQHKFRAYLEMKKCRQNYLRLKEATLCIQERFRANLVMKNTRLSYLRQHSATIFIQHKFRAFLEMKKCQENYSKLKKATLCIQEIFRANLAMKNTRDTYLHQRSSTIFIQHKFRAYLEMKKCQENYSKLKKATLCIQERFRANLVMKNTRETYLHQRSSTIFIQHKLRAYLEMKKCQENYLKLKKATLCIQERFRAKLAMKNTREFYLNQRRAAIFIQHKFRAYLEMKKCQQNYLKLKEATVCIQGRFRANLVMKNIRETYLHQRGSTIIIQRKFRAYLAMKKCQENYLKLKKATLCIQERFRGNLAMKNTREFYLNQRRAAIFIQHKFRAYLEMMKCRQFYLKLKEATLCIQGRFRANLVMKNIRETYLHQRGSTIIIQRKFRAYLEMKKCKENYLKLKKATLCIQERFRGNLAMKNTREFYLNQRRAAIFIQHKFRAYLEMKKCQQNYLQLKEATLCVQGRFRANLVMKNTRESYLYKRRSVSFIQQKFRAYLEMKKCRVNYLKLKKATLCIQERFRANLVMKNTKEFYLHQRRAAIFIQQKYRAYLEMKKCRVNYLKLKKVTLCVQERFRANLSMKNNRNSYLHQRRAAIFIQYKFKAYLEMKKCQENYSKLKKAILCIQERFRANLAMKKTRESYLHKQRAAIFIQQKFRAYLEMKKCRVNYLKLKKATLCIQERFRANLVMNNTKEFYLHQRRAAIFIQHKFRDYLEMKECQENYLKLKKATLCIQIRFRANLVTKNTKELYLHQRGAAIFIQHKFRGYLEMKECQENYLKLKKATLCIQKRFRANLVMKNTKEFYLHQRRAAIFIQHKFRAYLEMKECQENYLKLKKATLCIQERFRANLVMKNTRECYFNKKQSAIFIQRRFRAYFVMKICREHYLKLKTSIVFIQKRFRANLAMKKQRAEFLEMKRSVLVVQKHFRSLLLLKKCRTEFLNTRSAIITLQTYCRRFLIMRQCRVLLLQKREATIKIQRYFRFYLKKCIIQKMEMHIRAVIKIQSWVRMHAAKKQLQFLRENSKEIEEKRAQRRLNNAALKIQCLWRGYKTRKSMGKKMALIRQRSNEATDRALPEFSVCERNREAIDLLMYTSSMKEIIRALTILDFTTRLFPNLCIEVCSEITERLYTLLICTNRSVPDMDASILCVSILINLYKFKLTSSAVWKTQYVERLLLLLMHWSEKDGILFPYVCTLLWLFAQNPKYYAIIKAEENLDKILRKTHQQCERRQKMLTRMRNAPVPAYIKGQTDVFPSLIPDWGIININRPRIFRNPVFAIKCLIKKLDVSVK